ncbi:MAG: T9SS type A sorting domain-containing protein [Bacteroidetes bacterium]|nr:T9SS type A sorting domain-containing protein [Bacteroidota bacterium]
MMAQITFPTKPQETNYDIGLWKQKYEVRTDTIYKNIADMERLEGFSSDFGAFVGKEGTPDITIIHYTPIIPKGEGSERMEAMPEKLKTIILVPGGGFFMVDTNAVAYKDSCTNNIPTILSGAGYKVVMIKYEVFSEPEVRCLFDANDFIIGNICIPTPNARFRFEKSSIRSFWSLRSILRKDIFDKADSLGIDTTQVLLVGHSAGAILSLYTQFLDPSEIPTEICNFSLPASYTKYCFIESKWRTEYFNLPKFRGVMAMSGGSFYSDIFDNNIANINAAGTKIQLLHGACDELINEFGRRPAPWRRDNPEREQFTTGYSGVNKYAKLDGSAFVFKQLVGKLNAVQFEEGCEAGHNLLFEGNLSAYPYNPPVNPDIVFKYTMNHGAWNFCDKDDYGSTISTNHYVTQKILAFANSVLFNSPTFVSSFKGFTPELPYYNCPDTTDICTPTNILYTYNDGDCNKRALKVEGGECLEKAILYFWRFKTLPSGSWSAYTYTVDPEFDLSTYTPSNAYTVVDVIALNACDTVYKRDTIQFCNLCVGGCNPNRLGEVSIINNFDMQWQAVTSTIQVESDIAEQGNFQLIDTKGAVLYNWEASIEKGNTQVNMPKDIKQLSKGIYLIRYQSKTQSKTISIFNSK